MMSYKKNANITIQVTVNFQLRKMGVRTSIPLPTAKPVTAKTNLADRDILSIVDFRNTVHSNPDVLTFTAKTKIKKIKVKK